MNNFDYILLGAEKQAATSIATAYPHLKFLFVTELSVVDGWDLKNVTIKNKYNLPTFNPKKIIPLCSIWQSRFPQLLTNNIRDIRLSKTLNYLHSKFSESVLKTQNNNKGLKKWIIKGDKFHKPDAIEQGTNGDDEVPQDTYGCNFVFQKYFEAESNYISTGYRNKNNGIALGTYKVFKESHARDQSLLACESVSLNGFEDTLQAMLNEIEHIGFFTFNIIQVKGKKLITSFRPIPRATFATQKIAGADFTKIKPNETLIAKPNFKFIADSSYSSYTNF